MIQRSSCRYELLLALVVIFTFPPKISIANRSDLPAAFSVICQSNPPCDEGCEELRKQGMLSYDSKDYTEAIRLWSESYAISPYCRILMRVVKAYEKIDNCDAARSLLATIPKDTSDEFLPKKTEKLQNFLHAVCPPKPVGIAQEKSATSQSVISIAPAVLSPPVNSSATHTLLRSSGASPLQQEPGSKASPRRKRWWIWAAVAGGLAVTATGLGLGLSQQQPKGVPYSAEYAGGPSAVPLAHPLQ